MNNAIYRYIDFDGVIYNTNEIIDALILQAGLAAEQQDLITKLIRQIDFYNMIKNAKEKIHNQNFNSRQFHKRSRRQIKNNKRSIKPNKSNRCS